MPRTIKTPRKPLSPRSVITRKAKNKAVDKLKTYKAARLPKAKLSPKKKKATKAAAESKSPKSKTKKTKSTVPKYSSLVLEAIEATQKARVGASRTAIVRYIEENYPKARKHFVVRALTALVDGGDLKQKKLHFLLVNKPKKKSTDSPKKKTPRKKSKKDSGDESEVEKSPRKKKSTTDKKKTVKKTTKKTVKEGVKKSSRKKATEEKTKKRKRTDKAGSEKPAKKRTRKAKDSNSETDSGKPKPKGRGKKQTRSTSKAKSSELVWVWQFLENDKLYYNYDPTASDLVEEVYQNYLRAPGATDVRSVKSGQWNYMVDFRAMTQQNVQHEAHTKRKIRRIQVPADEKSDTSKGYE